MQIHELAIKDSSRSQAKKRVGRGGKRGTYSGRGIKGQKSRSGHKIRPAERDLIQRLPKLRGWKNRRIADGNVVFNVGALEKLGFTNISAKILRAKGLIPPTFRGKIKILGQGEIKSPVNIASDLLISKTASDKITKAGGKVAKQNG